MNRARWQGVRAAMLTAVAALPAAALDAQASCPRAVLPAYAHNDYRNASPLTTALALGFRGVEADVFLVGMELRVGHDRGEATRHGGTLETVYLAPLAALAARCGTVTGDAQLPFLVAIEFKETTQPGYDALLALLARHEHLLLPRQPVGAPLVEVVLVGWSPISDVTSERASIAAHLGMQQRLSRVGSRESAAAPAPARVRLLSLDYGKTMGRWWVTPAARQRWLATLRAAKADAPGRLLRVHNVPPDRLLYAALLTAGVDLIGTTQLRATHRLLSAP